MFLQQICINVNRTYMHIFTHMRNTNNQERILEKSETLFLTPSCIHTSSQATRYMEGSMFSPRVARVTFSTGTEIPILLPFSKPHFLQETFWNNPPSPHWPLPLTCCQNHQCSTGRDAASFGLWFNLSEFISFTQLGCVGVETWFLHLSIVPT